MENGKEKAGCEENLMDGVSVGENDEKSGREQRSKGIRKERRNLYQKCRAFGRVGIGNAKWRR